MARGSLLPGRMKSNRFRRRARTFSRSNSSRRGRLAQPDEARSELRPDIEGAFEPDLVDEDRFPARCLLLEKFDKIVGDGGHAQGFVRHFRGPYPEAFQSHRGLQVAESHFNAPSLRVKSASTLP
jgi:hypothetical protein